VPLQGTKSCLQKFSGMNSDFFYGVDGLVRTFRAGVEYEVCRVPHRYVDQVRKDLFVMARWRCWQVVVYILFAHTSVMSQTEGPGTEPISKSDEISQEVSIDVQDTVDIAIFHSNDLKGQFFMHGEAEVFLGGMASRIQMIREARRKGPVVVLDAGDALGPSTLSTWDKGKTMISLMKMAGYAAMTPGSHDLDLGLAELSMRRKEAEFPFLAANVIGKGGSESPLQEYVLHEQAGVIIGILGVVSQSVRGQTNPKSVAELTFGDPVESATRVVADLKNQGVHYIIAQVHMEEEEALSLARQVDGIDLVVAGGFLGLERALQVRALTRLVNGVQVVTTPSYGGYLGEVVVRFKGSHASGYKEIETSARLISIDAEIPSDAEAASLIAAVESAYAGATGEALGRIEGENLDDQARLVANLIRSHTEMEVGIVSRGTFREVSADSQMYLRDVDRFVRYDDSLVKLVLTGKQLRKIVSRSKGAGGGERGLLFAGVDPDAMTVNQRPVRDGESYQVATVEYLASGGGGYNDFRKGKGKINTGISLRSLLSAWLKAGSLSPSDFVALDRQGVWRSGWTLEGAFRRNYINDTTTLYRAQNERVSFLSGETSIAWNSATRYFLSREAGPNVIQFENTTDFGQLGGSFSDLETSTDRFDADITYRRRTKGLKVDPYVSTGISTAFSTNGGSRPFLWRSSVGFQKRLYRRLVVRFAGRGQRNYAADETDYGAEISMEYQRRLPQGGRFRSNTKSFFGFTDRKVVSVENYNTFSFPLAGKLSLTVRQSNFLYRVDEIQGVPVKGSAVRMDLTVGFAYGLDWKWF
jgi:5'-nucleotidase/UDP-sugar diphosphatase